VFLNVLGHVHHLVRRGRSATVAIIATVAVGRGVILLAFSLFGIEPVEVLCVLYGNVRVLHDNHENILHDRDKEEDKQVHEELGVPEVGLFEGEISVEEGVAGLNRKHRVEPAREVPETRLELPDHSQG